MREIKLAGGWWVITPDEYRNYSEVELRCRAQACRHVSGGFDVLTHPYPFAMQTDDTDSLPTGIAACKDYILSHGARDWITAWFEEWSEYLGKKPHLLHIVAALDIHPVTK